MKLDKKSIEITLQFIICCLIGVEVSLSPNPYTDYLIIALTIYLCLIMSLDIITDKLLKSVKEELDKDKNKEFIENELLKPIIQKVIDQMYPYFIGTGLLFMFMFIFIMIILLLNIRIYLCKNKTYAIV